MNMNKLTEISFKDRKAIFDRLDMSLPKRI